MADFDLTGTLRKNAREALLEAAASGRLEESLGAARQDTLRKHARDALLQATTSGRLADVLSSTRRGNEEQLRVQARSAFHQAISDGPLASALGVQQRTAQQEESENDQIRMRVRSTLIQASSDGRFASVLQARRESIQASAADDDLESLRARARQALSRALQDGVLQLFGRAISAGSNVSVRADIRNVSTHAYANGRLFRTPRTALPRDMEQADPHAEDPPEDLRMLARDILSQAAIDGHLEEALANSSTAATTGAAAHIIEEAQERARQSIESDIDSIAGNCTICLEGLELGQEFSVLPCAHHFHMACIGHWFQSRHTCPLCRVSTNERGAG